MDYTVWIPIVVGLLIYVIPTLFVGGLIAGVTIGSSPTAETQRDLKRGHRTLILFALVCGVVLHVALRGLSYLLS